MDSFTLNKIAGAVLGTCLAGMGIGIVAQGLYESGAPVKPGYALPEPKPEAAAGGGEKKPEIAPIAVRLEKADPKRGEADAKVCSACHNFQEGAGAKVGPDLWNVVDRAKGTAEGFSYSAGMKAKGGDWTYGDLDEFITKPSAYIQGTKMGYPGQDDPEKRADIIAYLRSLSKDPKPLPKVAEADKKQAQGDAKGADAKGGDEKKGGETKVASKEETDKAGGEAAGEAAFLKMVGGADPKKGQADAQVCAACHNFKKGGQALIGPPLWDVVNRKKGSIAGYDYSKGLKDKGGDWTIDDLNTWLTNPQKYIAGTKMGYPGEASEKKRAEIIAWLRTLSDKPVALPNTAEGEKKAEADHPGMTKDMPADAKPGNQKPPEPPNAPGSEQPKPMAPEPSAAADAPKAPDAGKPDGAAPPPPPPPPPPKPEGATPPAPPPPPPKSEGAVPPPPSPPAKPEQKTEAAPAEPTRPSMAAGMPASGEGPQPYQAADPQYPSGGSVENTLAKADDQPPALTLPGDKGEGGPNGPEPYAAPSPGDAR